MGTTAVAKPAVAGNGRPARVRLTRRGRSLALGAARVLVLAALLASAVAIGPAVLATDEAGTPVEVRTVTVQPGQTLWEIAAASGATGDLRDAVYEIEQLNHLDGPVLQIGARVDVPIGE